MKNWFVNIAAVSLISAIADVILPSAQISKYAKLGISLLLTVIILLPIKNFKAPELKMDIPYQVEIDKEGYNQVDIEFSKRFTSLLISDTGIDTISAKVHIDYDKIANVHIDGVKREQIDSINEILINKYNIPTEIVSYGFV